MADVAGAVVSLAVETLADLLVTEVKQLFGLEEKIRKFERPLREMVTFLQSIDALDKVPEEANLYIKEMREVIIRAEDLFEKYVRKNRQARRAAFYVRPFISIELMNFSSELEKLSHRMERVDEWRQQIFLTVVERSSPAVDKLHLLLQVREDGISLHPEVAERIKWVIDELAPLHQFLQETDGVQVPGKRQLIWKRELIEIFQFIIESFPDFQDEEEAKIWISDSDQLNISEVVSKIQDKILQLYRRYYAYGFGEILLENVSKSTFPRIRMSTPIPHDSILRCRMAYSSSELLKVDLKLIKALLEDFTSMEGLDERAKVWLNQIQQISVDLEALQDIEHHASKLRKIGCEIHDMVGKKMTYGINSALGEAGSMDTHSFQDRLHELSVNHPVHEEIWAILDKPFISETDLTRLVASVTKELKLMHALFDDANRMEKLDAKLKFWVEEMLGLAREANAALEVDFKSSDERIQAASKIKQVYNHIRIMSMWKYTYDIGDVKSSGTGIFNHNLKEAEPYPSEPIEKELELLRREIKLKQALNCDVKKIVELDVAAEASGKREATELISKSDNGFPRNLDPMKDKFEQLSDIRMAYSIEPRKRFPPPIVREIKVKLLEDHESSCFIIPILGMRHTDKEALQELIDNDNAIINYFNKHTWVHVPVMFSATSILKYMAKQIIEQQKFESVITSKAEAPTVEELMQMLQDILMHRRYLIVLDEIQTIEIWHFLKRAFQKISTGSRIILITNGHSCSLLNSSSDAIVKLRELPTEFVKLLPSYLRRCLFYFLLFPANLDIPTRRLIVLWVAEGLVRPNEDENESVEEAADRYLTELIVREIVCVKTRKHNGKVKACKLSEGTRDELRKAAEEAEFFQTTFGMISQLVDHHGTSGSCFIEINGNPNSSTSVLDYKKVQSFLSFDTQEGSKPGENIGKFLHKCISAGCFLELKVLDLERVFRPKLPKALSKLFLLKYLGLRWTYLEILPEYVKELFNLQVLDVKHTYINTLPKSIWEMEYLRHLYLSETYRTRFPGRPSSLSPVDLQTLWGAFIDEDTLVEGGLDTVLQIRKLGLSCQSISSQTRMQEQLSAVSRWISNLKLLEILRVKSRKEDGKASELHLETLESNKKLSTVYLLGKLQQSVLPTFPETLIEITLSGSELPEDPMEYLGNLPHLMILRLLAKSVMCPTMHCSTECFPKLKVLKIWRLESLMKCEVEEGALPSLEDLEIRSCNKLEVLPDGLQHVNTLKKFTLTSMPETFINETKAKQSGLWAKLVPQVE